MRTSAGGARIQPSGAVILLACAAKGMNMSTTSLSVSSRALPDGLKALIMIRSI